jgi:hypothetical protein
VVRRESDEFPTGQWWFEGTELQVKIPDADLDEPDLWGCHMIGRYQIQPVEGSGIKFELIEDSCGTRREIMIGEVWQREEE